jgi:hypothetical protein
VTTYKRAVNLMEAELGDELVALDPTEGACFGFNNVAASVWGLLDQPKSFGQLREKLMAEYEVDPGQCDRELKQLLNDMSAKGLVTTAR